MSSDNNNNFSKYSPILFGAAALAGAAIAAFSYFSQESNQGVSPNAHARGGPSRPPRPRYGSMSECPICLEVIMEASVSVLGCGHGFHANCIEDWFSTPDNGRNCPVCRNRHQ